MERRTAYYVHNTETDDFEKVDKRTYERMLDGKSKKYVNNAVLIHTPYSNKSIPMYDIQIENVTGSVIAGLFRLFDRFLDLK